MPKSKDSEPHIHYDIVPEPPKKRKPHGGKKHRYQREE